MKKVVELDPSKERGKVAIIRLEPLAANEQEIREAGLRPSYVAYWEGVKLRRKTLYEEALSEFEIALLVAPNVPSSGKLLSQCHFQRGWCFFKLEKPEDGIKEYTKALKLNPTYRDALFDRALTHEKLEHFEEAIADVKEVLELEPSEERAKVAILRLEALALEQREIREAGLGPTYDAYLEGEKLRFKKLYEEALAQFEMGLLVAPEVLFSRKILSKCHFKRGWCFHALRKYEDTIKEYTNALELNPTYTDALFERGLAYEMLEQFEEAITDVKKVLELEPSNKRAQVAIIRLEPLAAEKRELKEAGLGPAYDAYSEGEKLHRKKLYEEALSQFDVALQVASKALSSGNIISKCHFKRGWCFYALGNHEDEIKEYTKALKLNPTFRDALFDRGLAHEKLKHFEEAIADVKEVLKLEPSGERAKVAVLRLEALAVEQRENKEAGLGPTYDAYLEGEKLRLKKLYEEALAQFEIGLQVAPDVLSSSEILSKCHFKRGQCFYALEKPEDEIKEYTKALKLNPTYRDALFDRALAHERLEHFEEAIADVKEVLELERFEERAKVAILRLEALALEQREIREAGLGPTYDAYLEGEKLRFKKLYEEALARFQMGLQVAPEVLFSRKILSKCHFKRGWCFHALGNYEDAIKENTKALELDPTYRNALFERGLAHEKLENFEAAIADMRKILELNPSDVGAKRSILLFEPQKALAQANDAKSKGDQLCSENLYEEALSQYELALQVVPEVSSTMEKRCFYHYKCAWCLFELRKYEDAIKECTNALELNPMYADALFERALALERLSQFEEAITDFKKVLQMESSKERANIAILRLKPMAEEVQEIKKVGLGQAYEANLKGNKLLREGLYKESLSQYESFMLALQAAPEMPSSEKMRSTCHYNRAWCFYGLGKHEDEVEEYTKALEFNPTYKDALFDRAIAYEKLERFEEAIFDLKQVLQMESSEERAKLAILRLQLMAEEVQEIKKAGLGPAYEANLEGNKLFRKGLYNESLSKYENFMLALQAAPEMPSSEKMRTTCHYNRAWCFYELGNYEDAIKENTKALELDPTYRNALFERGLAHEKLENFEAAIADMRKILELNPSDVGAKRSILLFEPQKALAQANDAKSKGDQLCSENLFEEALSQYELALQVVPELSSTMEKRCFYHYKCAWCLFELGNYEDAVKENTKALELDPTYRDALFERGLAHENLENIEMAIADMKKALKLDPFFPNAKNALLRLESVAAGQQ